MANWEDVKARLYTQRTITKDYEGLAVQFTVSGDNGRSQIVLVERRMTQMTHADGSVYSEQWAVVQSPVGRVDEIDAANLLAATSELVCGGLGVMGDFYALRHAVPLTSLDGNEIDGPILLVAGEADELEARLTGSDRL